MKTAHDPRPAWQADDCPPWCAADHREDDLPEDRIHDSAGDTVPVVVVGPGLEAGDSGPEATEFTLRTSRRSGEHTEWVFIGEEHRRRQHLRLSRESARRLATALSRHLDSLG